MLKTVIIPQGLRTRGVYITHPRSQKRVREKSYHTWRKCHLLVAAPMEPTAPSQAPSPIAGIGDRRITQGVSLLLYRKNIISAHAFGPALVTRPYLTARD